MLFDTDVLIHVQRGNRKAAAVLQKDDERLLSIYSYMELQQTARDKRQLQVVRSFIHELGFRVLPLTPEIGHRASIYVEEYTLAHGVRAGDALVAATAIEHGARLCSANARHFRPIRELDLRVFRP